MTDTAKLIIGVVALWLAPFMIAILVVRPWRKPPREEDVT